MTGTESHRGRTEFIPSHPRQAGQSHGGGPAPCFARPPHARYAQGAMWWLDTFLAGIIRRSTPHYHALADRLHDDPRAATFVEVVAELRASYGLEGADDLIESFAREHPLTLLDTRAPGMPSADLCALGNALEGKALGLGMGPEGGLALHVLKPFGLEVATTLADETLRAFTSLEIFRAAGPSPSCLVRRAEGLRELRQLRLVTADDESVRAAAGLRRLEELAASCEGVSEAAIEGLGALGGLRRVQLFGQVDSSQAAALASLPALVSLALEAPSSEAIWAAIGKLASLTSFTARAGKTKPEPSWLRQLAPLGRLRELELSGCDAGDEGAEVVGGLAGLEELDLTDAHLGPRGAGSLAALKGLRRLRLRAPVGAWGLVELGALGSLVDLSIDKCGELRGDAFEPLRGLTRLRCLRVSGLPLGDEGAQHIGALHSLTFLEASRCDIGPAGALALSQVGGLRVLDLHDNPLGGRGAAALSKLGSLLDLNLSDCDIGDGGGASLGKLERLICLQISGNRIGDEGAAGLARLGRLETLYIGNNRIGDAGAARLGALPALRVLSIGGNEIGDTGAIGLGQAALLQSLDAPDNRIGDAGAAAIGRLASLEILSLSSNLVGDEGALALASLPRLRELYLARNRLGAPGLAALARARSLRVLWLESNGLDGAAVLPLAALDSLRSLGLGDNPIDAASLGKLVEALPRCVVEHYYYP